MDCVRNKIMKVERFTYFYKKQDILPNNPIWLLSAPTNEYQFLLKISAAYFMNIESNIEEFNLIFVGEIYKRSSGFEFHHKRINLLQTTPYIQYTATKQMGSLKISNILAKAFVMRSSAGNVRHVGNYT